MRKYDIKEKLLFENNSQKSKNFFNMLILNIKKTFIRKEVR